MGLECGPCEGAFQAEPLVVNPGNTAWRFGHSTCKTPPNHLSELLGSKEHLALNKNGMDFLLLGHRPSIH